MNIITAKYKLRKFIDEIMTGKALTNECISHCSKIIFEFIRNYKELQEIYKGMTLSTLYENNIEKEYWINWKGRRLTADDLYYKLV